MHLELIEFKTHPKEVKEKLEERFKESFPLEDVEDCFIDLKADNIEYEREEMLNYFETMNDRFR